MGERLAGVWDGIRGHHQWKYGRTYFRWYVGTGMAMVTAALFAIVGMIFGAGYFTAIAIQ